MQCVTDESNTTHTYTRTHTCIVCVRACACRYTYSYIWSVRSCAWVRMKSIDRWIDHADWFKWDLHIHLRPQPYAHKATWYITWEHIYTNNECASNALYQPEHATHISSHPFTHIVSLTHTHACTHTHTWQQVGQRSSNTKPSSALFYYESSPRGWN